VVCADDAAEGRAGGRAEVAGDEGGEAAVTKKQIILIVKIIVLLAVAWLVGKQVYKAWTDVEAEKITVNWAWGAVSAAACAGSMLTSALIWRWLAWQMGERHSGRHLKTGPLVGAYTFSQMGKYIPGKVALLAMRIERAGRVGMPVGVCTLATLLENALYVISGGLVGLTSLVRILKELYDEGHIGEWVRQYQGVVLVLAIVGLFVGSSPKVFYGLVNVLLRKMKKPEVAPEQRLRMPVIVLAVLGFVPCWAFGGVALWATARSVYPLNPADCLWFAGAYALSVILGMVFLTPGGLGVREAVLFAAIMLQLSPAVGHAEAVKMAGIVSLLQRLFQVIAEVLLGVIGGVVTSLPKGAASEQVGAQRVESERESADAK
jgi:uncharacterized membrane protein YbhN (UPF0104 family)